MKACLVEQLHALGELGLGAAAAAAQQSHKPGDVARRVQQDTL